MFPDIAMVLKEPNVKSFSNLACEDVATLIWHKGFESGTEKVGSSNIEFR